MGIPSYFSYIVKNHSNIIKKLGKDVKNIDNLYLDSNSIIYDTVHKNLLSKFPSSNLADYEKNIIELVCKEIHIIIKNTSPTQNIIIAFDGIAPVAKLNQQRERRYKSWFINEINKEIDINYIKEWDTTAITPGTPFMKKLDKYLKTEFQNININNCNIIVSTSDIAGEGEHKIFEYIRENQQEHNNHTTVVYGLDADLIMLSLNHLNICKDIKLYRETPEFIKSINTELEPDQKYLLDITELSFRIVEELVDITDTDIDRKYKMFDYIFLCFLLGNDFMPHFPAINIRTTGMDRLLLVYKTVIKGNEYLFDGNNINWKIFRKFIQYLSENEIDYILEEYKTRERYEKRQIPNRTVSEKMQKFQLIPCKERYVEKYINPKEGHWISRYYKKMFDIDFNEDSIKNICKNYLEGLEWTAKYYTTRCVDWRWCYRYDYPPLLVHLIKYIPYFATTFVKEKEKNPVTNNVQLSYVLPKKSLIYLPHEVYNKIKYKEWYVEDCEFKWSFCKYFWESHPNLPHIDINELELLVN